MYMGTGSWKAPWSFPHHGLPFKEFKLENLSEVEITWPVLQVLTSDPSESPMLKFTNRASQNPATHLWGLARHGCVFRQKVKILITKAGIQGEVCSGHKPDPASSDPDRWIAYSGTIGVHVSKRQGIFLSFMMKTLFIMSGEIMRYKFPLSNHIKFTFLHNLWSSLSIYTHICSQPQED